MKSVTQNAEELFEVYVREIYLLLNSSNSCTVCHYSQVTSTLNWYDEYC